jgi:hypothetical protein
MKETRNELVRIYSGTEVSVIMLKGTLEDIGIGSVIRNGYKSGIEAGFVGGVLSAVDLFIQQSDYEKARPVISEFTARNKPG